MAGGARGRRASRVKGEGGAQGVTVRERVPARKTAGGRSLRTRWAKGQIGCLDPSTRPQSERQRCLARWGGAAKPQQGKMFNVESAERVELCESLLTWVCADRRFGGRPSSPGCLSGIPLCLSRGASAEGSGAVTSGAWAGGAGGRRCGPRLQPRSGGGRRGMAGRARRFGPGSQEDLPGLRCWPDGG